MHFAVRYKETYGHDAKNPVSSCSQRITCSAIFCREDFWRVAIKDSIPIPDQCPCGASRECNE